MSQRSGEPPSEPLNWLGVVSLFGFLLLIAWYAGEGLIALLHSMFGIQLPH